MNNKKQDDIKQDVFLLLIRGSLKAAPFNAALAVLLALNFIYHQVPIQLVLTWVYVFLALIVIRWLVSYWLRKTNYYHDHYERAWGLFYLFTCLIGIVWGTSYFIFLPYFDNFNEAFFVIILGGVAAGSIANMSMRISVYYGYVLPMFAPIIVYNFCLLQFDTVILAILYSLFVMMLLLTTHANSRLLLATIRLNAEKERLIQTLRETNHKLKKSMVEVKTMSITDALTGLFNRRYFDMILSKELGRAKRGKYEINIVFIDIDNFKSVNDTYGHPAGDEFLIYVAQVLQSTARRASDNVFRLGGDEFALILPMPIRDVFKFCSLIQKEFNQHNKYKQITLSMGILALEPKHELSYQAVINAVDDSLYQAKETGKNKIVLHVVP